MDFWPDVVDDGLAKAHAEGFGDFMTCSAEASALTAGDP